MNTLQEVLDACEVEGKTIKFPKQQIDRPLYMEAKKALEKAGGKWKGGKVWGFVFDTDPTDKLRRLRGGDNVNDKKEFQFFETPSDVINMMLGMLPEHFDRKSIKRACEPSCGRGKIVRAINQIFGISPDVYEAMPENLQLLEEAKKAGDLSFNLMGENWLQHNPRRKYDLILANPPFTKGQDVDHITHMYDCLNKGGVLIAIASSSWTFNGQKKFTAFRDFVRSNKGYKKIDLDSGAFKESGTLVNTTIIRLIKE